MILSTSSSSWWPSARLSDTLSTVLGSWCSVGCRSCVLTSSGPLKELLCQDMVRTTFICDTNKVQMIIEIMVSTSSWSRWPSVRLSATLSTASESRCSVGCRSCVVTSSGPSRGVLCQDMVSKTLMFRTIKVQMIIEIMVSSSSASWWTSARLSATFSTASGSRCSVGCRSCVVTSSGPLQGLLCRDTVSKTFTFGTNKVHMIIEMMMSSSSSSNDHQQGYWLLFLLCWDLDVLLDVSHVFWPLFDLCQNYFALVW